ncbi:hypothetical protein ACP9OK_10770 [Pseudomonas sp. B11]
MATAALIVRTPGGKVLYDTSKAVYGLIKAGPVTYHGPWYRLDPATGRPNIYADNMYKFEVENAISPIVFVYGMSGKPTQSKEGNKQVFYFGGPVSGIRVYCFDIMQPIFTGPALKTRAPDGSFTFNSLQFPLNVKGTSTPPSTQAVPNSTMIIPFAGGGLYWWPEPPGESPGYVAGIRSQAIRVPLDATKKYAAHIPWNRGVQWIGDWTNAGGHASRWQGSGAEGCYGEDGAVSHIIWASEESTFASVPAWYGVGFFNMANDRRPACSYIDLAEYPYPFNA